MAPKRKFALSPNPHRSGASSFSDSTPYVKFYDDKARQDFQRTFLDAAFIRNAKSSFRIFLIVTYPLSLTVGVMSPFVTSQLAVPP